MTTDVHRAASRLQWSWRLGAEPRALWPLVSDTDRLNELVGLAPVERRGTQGAYQRVRSRIMGLPLEWLEEPFQWQHGERLSVRREFNQGPLRRYCFSLVLEPEGGGTRLILALDLEPRIPALGPLIRLAASGLYGRWDRALRLLDALAVGAPLPLATDERLPGAFEERILLLQQAGQPPALVRRLAHHVARGPASQVACIQPYALADRWGIGRSAVLDLCIEAATTGLLEVRWSLLCPHCRGPKLTVGALSDVRQTASCDACEITFSAAFDQSVELSFRPRADLRHVATPLYCVGSPGRTPHFVYQDRLEPSQTRRLDLDVPQGAYRIRCAGQSGAIWCDFEEASEDLASVQSLSLGSDTLAGEVAVGGPRLVLVLDNSSDRTLQVVVERVEWSDAVVTAALISSHDGFRRHFPGEVMAPGVCIAAKLMAFMAFRRHGIALACSTGAIEAIERAAAHLDEQAVEVVVRHRGTVVGSAGDLTMCAFYDPLDALEAALALAGLPVTAFRESGLDGLGFSVGLDAGPCLASNEAGRLGYFGACVSRATEAATRGRLGDLVLSRQLIGDPGIQLALGGRAHVEPLESDLLVMSVR